VSPTRTLVVLGLTITSSWGNGHATTWRSLVRQLHALGHRVLFLERDVPWYAQWRDDPAPPGCRVGLYTSIADLDARFRDEVAAADAVIVTSYVPEGCDVVRWASDVATGPLGFYDIDTPVTLGRLDRGDAEYLSADLVPRFDVYLSFTGGPTLRRLETRYGARRARALYCSVDPDLYRPVRTTTSWSLGYLGTYSPDRQPKVQQMLLDVAARRPDERFAVGGPCYPETDRWPANVEHFPHVAPAEHPRFYARQRLTLNVTRAEMVQAGWSPSVRLFEAAACGVPIVSDPWPGLEDVLEPGREVLLASSTEEVLDALARSDADLRRLATRARERVLGAHTGRHRALELVRHLEEAGAARLPRHASARSA
jgi:spore maturation protein CgeB